MKSPNEPDVSHPAEVVILPVGPQVITVPPGIAARLRELSDLSDPQLYGTRVWVGETKGKLVVHLGDVEGAPLDD